MSHNHVHNGPPAAGHNRPTAQWQTPHKPESAGGALDHHHEHDLDLVEQAFVEGFSTTSDPTSFLRLSGIAFTATLNDGTRLQLLRVALDKTVDVASLSPAVGGQSFRYDPLPASMVSRRDQLRFIYFDGTTTRPLTFEEARSLPQPPT
ncbi:MAG: hypothetical protein AAGJ94_02030 [Pseudomonadota bacterium]